MERAAKPLLGVTANVRLASPKPTRPLVWLPVLGEPPFPLTRQTWKGGTLWVKKTISHPKEQIM